MHITLGVTGGVAAYKAAELTRRLQQDGFTVQVVMTRAAREFVAPLTFAALTGQKVITDLFGDSAGGPANLESAIEHIAVAQRTDLLLVAPATADVIAKFARGIADDFLTTLFLATTAPVVIAPAMNVNMWENAATQANIKRLEERGVKIVPPDAGYLACGMVGAGRLAANESVVAAAMEALGASQATEKMKRKGAMSLELEPTVDILAELGAARKGSQILIGFAAETSNALENARQKLAAKGVDAIVVNDVSQPGIGFDSERNAVSIVMRERVIEVPETSKWEVAHRVLDAAVELRKAKRSRPAFVRSDEARK